MSYILDALKKMEHEKVKKNRAGGMTSISGELFREERSRPARGGGWRIIVVAVITACLGMAATWFYLKPGKAPVKAARPAPAPTSALQQASPTPPQPAAPAPAPASAPPAAAPQPAAQAALPAAALKAAPAAQAPAGQPVVAATAPVAAPAPAKAESRNKETRKQASPALVELKPSAVTVAPPADIKVSGIAWQEERNARRAVVNGFLMKEGSVVSGARIVEIQQDRVRFSSPGGDFELSMVASGIPGANR